MTLALEIIWTVLVGIGSCRYVYLEYMASRKEKEDTRYAKLGKDLYDLLESDHQFDHFRMSTVVTEDNVLETNIEKFCSPALDKMIFLMDELELNQYLIISKEKSENGSPMINYTIEYIR